MSRMVSAADLEVRQHGWVPLQDDQAKIIGHKWIEAVHLYTNKPEGATWKFGVNELK